MTLIKRSSEENKKDIVDQLYRDSRVDTSGVKVDLAKYIRGHL